MESMMEPTLESAIPSHLRYVPPYPSFVARHATSVTRVVMAYFGIQYGSDASAAEPALAHITQAFAATDGPGHWDRARLDR